MSIQRLATEYSAKAWQQAYYGAKAGSMHSFEKLMEMAEPKIVKTAKRYARCKADADDFAQEARAYIVKLVNLKEEPVECVKNYLGKSIKGAILQARQRLSVLSGRFKSPETLSFVDKEKYTPNVLDAIFTDKRVSGPAVKCYLNEVLAQIRKLPKREREILLEKVISPRGQAADLSAKYKTSQANIEQIRSRTRKELAELCDYFKS